MTATAAQPALRRGVAVMLLLGFALFIAALLPRPAVVRQAALRESEQAGVQMVLGESDPPGNLADDGDEAFAADESWNFDETNPVHKNFSHKHGIHLISSFFKGSYHHRRLKELLEALRRNVANEKFEAVHILWEDANPRPELQALGIVPQERLDRLVTIKVSKQPTYQKMFQYANVFLKRGTVVVLANADIYFLKDVGHLKFGRPGGSNDMDWRSYMALSRRHSPDCKDMKYDWKGIPDLCVNYIGSHDAFVFAPPVPARVLRNVRHTQNHSGAENVVIWAFMWAKNFTGHGSNPCKRIKAFHLHCGVERKYTVNERIDQGRHGDIKPGILDNDESKWNLIF